MSIGYLPNGMYDWEFDEEENKVTITEYESELTHLSLVAIPRDEDSLKNGLMETYHNAARDARNNKSEDWSSVNNKLEELNNKWNLQ